MTGQLSLGELFRTIGMETADEAEDQSWKDLADEAIRYHAGSMVPFTAEDVRLRAGDPSHMNSMGARLSAHARHGCIRAHRIIEASRPQAHRRLLRAWVGSGKKCPPDTPESIQKAPLAEATGSLVGETELQGWNS